jgi:hypothetical protein
MVEKKVMNNIRNCIVVVVVVAREKAAATAAAQTDRRRRRRSILCVEVLWEQGCKQMQREMAQTCGGEKRD